MNLIFIWIQLVEMHMTERVKQEKMHVKEYNLINITKDITHSV